ncbi:MAG: hypothetical protein PVG83_01070 [Acidimicrobiia bacterium]|jgi:hypothetical protein
MNHSLITTELGATIREERLRQARQRREQSRRLVGDHRAKGDAMRMALGPGIQFGGVTEHVLRIVSKTNQGAQNTLQSI